MTDHELLELAAKAVGGEYVEHVGFDDDTGSYVTHSWLLTDGQLLKWNPRDDDGDAQRLAVKLRLSFCIENAHIIIHSFGRPNLIIQPYNGDPYAATRRAIVRAAAEIGKEMK